MANPVFGSLVSESGSGCCWYGNSQSNRLTPWNNDPISDASTEAIYIRDEDSGVFWTPTPLPVRELDAYRARHADYRQRAHSYREHLLNGLLPAPSLSHHRQHARQPPDRCPQLQDQEPRLPHHQNHTTSYRFEEREFNFRSHLPFR